MFRDLLILTLLALQGNIFAQAVIFTGPLSFTHIESIDKTDTLNDLTFNPSSIFLSDSLLVVGESGDDQNNTDAGSIHIFEKDSSSQWEETKKISATSAEVRLGFSVLASSDDLILGADTNQIVAFRKASGDWTTNETLSSSGNGAFFGSQILSHSSSFVISAPNYTSNGFDVSGRIYTYYLSSGNFVLGQTLDSPSLENVHLEIIEIGGGNTIAFPTHQSLRASFGSSVSIEENLMLVGAPQVTNNFADEQLQTGTVYLYEHNGSQWILKTVFTPPLTDTINYLNYRKTLNSGLDISEFGQYVQINSGNVYILYQGWQSNANQGEGALYCYEPSGESYELKQALKFSSGSIGDFAVENNTMAIRLSNRNIKVLSKIDGSWKEQSTIESDVRLGFKNLILKNGLLYEQADSSVNIYQQFGAPLDLEPSNQSQSASSSSSGGGCFLKGD